MIINSQKILYISALDIQRTTESTGFETVGKHFYTFLLEIFEINFEAKI